MNTVIIDKFLARITTKYFRELESGEENNSNKSEQSKSNHITTFLEVLTYTKDRVRGTG